MIKNSLIVLLTLFSFSLLAQKSFDQNYVSNILGSNRNLKIYLPEGYEENDKKNYPLTIVLNGDYLFDLYVGNSVLFSKKDKAPQQIIVGISMEKTKGKDISFDEFSGRLTSSATNFYRFIRDEVLFFMESNYRTSPFLTLVGDGYSANFITHFLKEETTFINSFVCINPTFSDFISQQLQSYNLERFSREDNTFYVYTNNSTSFSPGKQSKIEQVQRNLSTLKMKNFNVVNDSLTTSSSISAISEAIPRALNKIFEIYSGISKEEFDQNIKNLTPPKAIAYLENKYLEIEYLFGSSIGIRERDIYAIEEIIINEKKGEYLRDFGKMILKLFPSSPLGDYYIGRFYEDRKMSKKALIQYKIGYGKMDPSDPNSDAFYENILRLGGQ